MMAYSKLMFRNVCKLSTMGIRTLPQFINGFQYSLCKKDDHAEALDLRYNHFIKEEFLALGRGGHRERTDMLDSIGTDLLSKGCSIKVTDTQNDRIVALLIGSVSDRRDMSAAARPMDHLDEYVKKFGSVSGSVMYLYDLYGNPRFVFEKHPSSQRYFDMKNVFVHQSYRNCGIAQELLHVGANTAKEEWGCDGASGMISTASMRKITEKQEFVPYKIVELDSFCVDKKLIFPHAKEATVSFVFKHLK